MSLKICSYSKPSASSTVYDVKEEDTAADYYDYVDDDESRDEPESRQDWFDLRTRRKRQAPEEPKKENTLYYTVCVRYALISQATIHFINWIHKLHCLQWKVVSMNV